MPRKPTPTKPTSPTAHRMAKQADTKIATEETTPEPEAPAEPPAAAEPPQSVEQMVVQVALIFTVDGAPVAHTPLVAQVARPADDQALQLQVALDGRVLMQLLEPHFGPNAASQQVAKLWAPGR